MVTKKARNSSPQIELRVYADFSEVRTQVQPNENTLQLTFPQGVWAYVVPSSLGLLDLPYRAVTHAEAPSWLAALEGQRVMVRLAPLAPPREATLVRAADLLVQDEHGFYRVNEDQLIFYDAPPEHTHNAARQVTFWLAEAGTGTLTYLTRGLQWQPRYTLNTAQESTTGVLSALADVTNNTMQEHVPERLELIAGDVQMDLGEYEERARGISGGRMYSMAVAGAAAPELEELEELAGLYRYEVNHPPPLAAHATVSVPFLPDTTLEVLREARLETLFTHVGAQRGNFNRGYMLTADHNLPGGKMTIREDGRIVGQHEIQETPAEHPIRFTLGRDPDVTFTRTLRPIGTERHPEGKGKVRRVSYEVTFSVRNNKKRRIEATIRERHYDRIVTIAGAEPNMDNIATLSTQIEPGESAELSYTVTVDR